MPAHQGFGNCILELGNKVFYNDSYMCLEAKKEALVTKGLCPHLCIHYIAIPRRLSTKCVPAIAHDSLQ